MTGSAGLFTQHHHIVRCAVMSPRLWRHQAVGMSSIRISGDQGCTFGRSLTEVLLGPWLLSSLYCGEQQMKECMWKHFSNCTGQLKCHDSTLAFCCEWLEWEAVRWCEEKYNSPCLPMVSFAFCSFSHPWSTTVWKSSRRNSSNQQFVRFPWRGILSRVMKSLAVRLHSAWVNPSVSHWAAIAVIRSTVIISLGLCSSHPCLFNKATVS